MARGINEFFLKLYLNLFSVAPVSRKQPGCGVCRRQECGIILVHILVGLNDGKNKLAET